jgi:hypothetical protein
MRNSAFLALTLTSATLFGSTARAEDSADARAIVDKAIQAVGGAEKLLKVDALTWKAKGKFSGLGEPIDFTGTWAVQPAKNQISVSIQLEFNGMQIKHVQVFDGTKGWVATMGDVKDMDESTLAESKEEVYASRIASLAGLKDPKVKITSIGDSKVDDRAVAGIKVTSESHKDISLYFDKETGLLIKALRKVKAMSGEDVDQEALFSDFKVDSDGIKRPKKQEMKRDGKDFISMEITDLKAVDSLPGSTFAKPGE